MVFHILIGLTIRRNDGIVRTTIGGIIIRTPNIGTVTRDGISELRWQLTTPNTGLIIFFSKVDAAYVTLFDAVICCSGETSRNAGPSDPFGEEGGVLWIRMKWCEQWSVTGVPRPTTNNWATRHFERKVKYTNLVLNEVISFTYNFFSKNLLNNNKFLWIPTGSIEF